MRTQVVHDRLDTLAVGSNPGLHPRPEVHRVRRGASRIGSRPRFAISRLEGAKEIPLAAAPIVHLWRGPPSGAGRLARGHRGSIGRTRPGSSRLLAYHPLLPWKALCAFGPHVIQAHYDTARRRRGIKRRDDPLLAAQAGATRSPTQGSWVRQRHPSRRKSSSRRARWLGSPLTSWRSGAHRSSVHLANGRPSSWGVVRRVAMTALPCPEV